MANKADFDKGVEIRKQLNRERYGKATSALAELAPELDEMLTDTVFGRVWARPQLEIKMRSVATIAALTVMGRLPQLKGHILNGHTGGRAQAQPAPCGSTPARE